MLTYDNDKHLYTWNGSRVPSVTQVIREWMLIGDQYVNRFTGKCVAKSAMEQGAARGKAIHDGLNILIQGKELDWSVLDPALFYPMQAIQRWIERWDPVLVEIGFPRYSSIYGYAGTLDVMVVIRLGRQRALWLIDAKTTRDALMVGPQTAAYERLYRENEKYRGPIDRISMYIPASEQHGRECKIIPLNNRNDFKFFEACLVEYFYLSTRTK